MQTVLVSCENGRKGMHCDGHEEESSETQRAVTIYPCCIRSYCEFWSRKGTYSNFAKL